MSIIKKKFSILIRGLKDLKLLVTGKYPTFVYRNKFSQNEIPVFCFHSVNAKSFEKILRYLKSNEYNSLTTDEFYSYMIDTKRTIPDKHILLTFDDCERNLWTIVYPLLKKYGFRATSFIVPGLINESNQSLYNLEDVWEKKVGYKNLLNQKIDVEPFCNWKEIKVMHDSGIIDFQSHTLKHELVFTSPFVVDFISTLNRSKFHFFEFNIYSNNQDTINTYYKKMLGAPIYHTAPRMSRSLRYIEDINQITTCVEWVKKNGNEEFFKEKNWKRVLLNLLKDYKNGRKIKDKYEKKIERKMHIYNDLKKSKEIMEYFLPKKVKHLAYPWGIGSELSINLSKKAGYVTNFWGLGGNELKNILGKDPYKISRIGEDFIYCLPGKGRTSIMKVIKKKIQNKLLRENPYLSH